MNAAIKQETIRPTRTSSTKPRLSVFLAAPDTQIIYVAGPYHVCVRVAELWTKDRPTAKSPYSVMLASTEPDSEYQLRSGAAGTI
jgi:hypothetical protein